ncbi:TRANSCRIPTION FACTOR MYB51-LIKE ISOFORM X1 [Salix viminalis]|uniref:TRANSCRIPTION FACTOR MYB51-LIKE ISOFORM X1 n=1 Tax=Salix viminalis TaxID=40686 RepID=A0A9Q0QBG6_SALVM|nr:TRANSCRIPTION FACTOR MYB51-LIKE ISOFORM X1 [Salix viminalis]
MVVQVRNHENGSKFKKESGGRKRNVSELSSKRKQKDGEDATTRTKIHAPKARRVSPSLVNISADNSMVGSSSHTGVVDHDSNWSVSDHLEADKNIDGDLAWAPHHYLDDLVQDDLSGQDYSPANIDDMLEEMFGEYQQLLNTDNHAQLLDSFVDSLLA